MTGWSLNFNDLIPQAYYYPKSVQTPFITPALIPLANWQNHEKSQELYTFLTQPIVTDWFFTTRPFNKYTDNVHIDTMISSDLTKYTAIGSITLQNGELQLTAPTADIYNTLAAFKVPAAPLVAAVYIRTASATASHGIYLLSQAGLDALISTGTVDWTQVFIVYSYRNDGTEWCGVSGASAGTGSPATVNFGPNADMKVVALMQSDSIEVRFVGSDIKRVCTTTLPTDFSYMAIGGWNSSGWVDEPLRIRGIVAYSMLLI